MFMLHPGATHLAVGPSRCPPLTFTSLTCIRSACTFASLFSVRGAPTPQATLSPPQQNAERDHKQVDKTERVHADGAMPAAAAVVLHEDGQEDKKRAVYTREDYNSAPLAAGLASADKMRRWADGRATEGAIIAPRCGLLP